MGVLLQRHRWWRAVPGLVVLLGAARLLAQGPPVLGEPMTGGTNAVPGLLLLANPVSPAAQPQMTFPFSAQVPWTWTLLPDSLLFRSYLAGPKEPRLSSAWLYESDAGWLWELQIGARVGLLRFGSPAGSPPEGWQVDLWGSAFPRLNIEHNYDLDAADFNAGLPLTWRQGPFQTKVELRHISSHLGDEFLLRNPGFQRLNYVRDSFATGFGYFPTPNLRLYVDAEYAFNRDGGAEPWQFQFGAEYSPQPVVHWLGWAGTPFAALNGSLREEVDFGGGLNVVAGWQLRGPESGRLLRLGLQYYNGKSYQFSFFDQHEQLLGVGLWYDY
jgi:hypothetical protein